MPYVKFDNATQTLIIEDKSYLRDGTIVNDIRANIGDIVNLNENMFLHFDIFNNGDFHHLIINGLTALPTDPLIYDEMTEIDFKNDSDRQDFNDLQDFIQTNPIIVSRSVEYILLTYDNNIYTDGNSSEKSIYRYGNSYTFGLLGLLMITILRFLQPQILNPSVFSQMKRCGNDDLIQLTSNQTTCQVFKITNNAYESHGGMSNLIRLSQTSLLSLQPIYQHQLRLNSLISMLSHQKISNEYKQFVKVYIKSITNSEIHNCETFVFDILCFLIYQCGIVNNNLNVQRGS